MFNVTVTDVNVGNVTFYLNNSLNETNTSRYNGTYLFKQDCSRRNHTWYMLVYDRANNSNQTLVYNVSTETDVTVPGVTIRSRRRE